MTLLMSVVSTRGAGDVRGNQQNHGSLVPWWWGFSTVARDFSIEIGLDGRYYLESTEYLASQAAPGLKERCS
jgi:hypothetical protein